MKQILISIKPKWVAKILDGEKTLEIRKTAPKEWVDYINGKTDKKPEPMIVNIYCTKGDYIGYLPKEYVGKVVAKCLLRKVERLTLPHTKFGTKEQVGCEWERTLQTKTMDEPDILMASRIEYVGSIYRYLFSNGEGYGYAWHIDLLPLFAGVRRKLWNFCTYKKPSYVLQRAPQSWIYVEENE